MSRLRLYSTSHCHLCEQAEQLLRHLGQTAEVIDIAYDDALFERYGARIPVLQRQDTQDELGWPFDLDQLQTFLQNHAASHAI